MKKYCPKCGKLLEENNKCECKNNKSIFQMIIDFVTNPVDVVNENSNTKEISCLILIITSMVATFCMMDTIFNISSYMFMPILRYFVTGTLICFASFLLLTIILYLIAKQNNEIEFESLLNTIAVSSISFIYAFTIALLINILFNEYVWIIILLGAFVFGYLIVQNITKKYKIEESKALLYTVLSVIIISAIIMILL